jgi:hypothetical protein
MQPNPKAEWLDSKAARKALGISACGLSHLREAGKLVFQKRGNAYLYRKAEILRISKQNAGRSQSIAP